MNSRMRKDLSQILHPYMFVLKEGNEIKSDLLEYSLLMVSVGVPETIPSPKDLKDKSIPSISEFDQLRASLSSAIDNLIGF